jgi:membrane AbrB-like protein
MTPTRRKLLAWLLTLALGGAGGALFSWLTLPLPWMLGAMAATLIAALAGQKVATPSRLKTTMVAVLGLMLGGTFNPAVVDQVARWAASIAILLVYAAATTGLVMTYLRRGPGYDPVTSYFAAAPGGLSEMTLLGGAMGGDDRIISISHSIRIVVVVATIPFWYRFTQGYTSTSAGPTMGSILGLDPLDALVLASSAIAGSIAANMARLPSPTFIGPLVVSAGLHVTGITESKPPSELIVLAQVVMGAAVGCRFVGVSLRSMGPVIIFAAGSAVIMLALAVGFSSLLSGWLGLPFDSLLLAFVPGGLTEMSLIAISLHSDVAFVATHHTARIMIVIFLGPLIFHLVRKWMRRRTESAPTA